MHALKMYKQVAEQWHKYIGLKYIVWRLLSSLLEGVNHIFFHCFCDPFFFFLEPNRRSFRGFFSDVFTAIHILSTSYNLTYFCIRINILENRKCYHHTSTVHSIFILVQLFGFAMLHHYWIITFGYLIARYFFKAVVL